MNRVLLLLFSVVVLFSSIQTVYAETIIISEDTTFTNFVVDFEDILVINQDVVVIVEGLMKNFGQIENNGEIRNFGEIVNFDDFDNFGTIENLNEIRNNKNMNSDGLINNFGLINHNSGFFSNVGTINNFKKGTIDISAIFLNTRNESKDLQGIIFNQGIFRVTTLSSQSFGATQIINDGGLFEITENGGFSIRGTFENINGGLVRVHGFLGSGNSKGGHLFDNWSLVENYGRFSNLGIINNHEKGEIVNFKDGEIINQVAGDSVINNSGIIKNVGVVWNSNGKLLSNEGIFDNYGVIGNRGIFLNNSDAILNNLCESSFENIGLLDNFGTISGSIVIKSGGSLIIHQGGTIDTECITKTPPKPVIFSLSQKSQESNDSSAKSYLNRPTFGLSHSTHLPLVENGFTANENSFEITDNWHTPFEKQTIHVGELNTFSAKAYSPFGLQWVEFMFGIPEVGKAHESEAVIEVLLDKNGELQEIVIEQKDNLIDSKTITAEAKMVECTSSDIDKNCNQVTISASFNEAPMYDVFGLKGVDSTRRNQITYLNEGFAVDGESLNPPKTKKVDSGKKGVGLVDLTLVDKRNRIWIDELGNNYEENSFGTFVKTNSFKVERDDPLSNVMTRQNSHFEKIVHYEMKRALQVFDSSIIQGELPESFSHILPERINKLDDPEIQYKMALEYKQAELKLSQMPDY